MLTVLIYKCIAESYADIEWVNSLQGTTEVFSNLGLFDQVIDTDGPEDHCMDGIHENN